MMEMLLWYFIIFRKDANIRQLPPVLIQYPNSRLKRFPSELCERTGQPPHESEKR